MVLIIPTAFRLILRRRLRRIRIALAILTLIRDNRLNLINLILHIIDNAVDRIHSVIDVTANAIHQPFYRIISQISDVVQRTADTVDIVPCFLMILGNRIAKRIHFPVQAVNRILILLLERLCILAGITGGLAESIRHLYHQTIHSPQIILQLFQTVRQIFGFHIRLSLAGNTAHVLTSQNLPFIFTFNNGSALSSGNASHVVAHMRIPHRAAVNTACDSPGGDPCNSAAVISGNHILRQIQASQIHAIQIQRRLQILSIHHTFAYAVLKQPFIFTTYTAGAVSGRNRAGCTASHHLPVRLIIPYDSADRFGCGHCAMKGTARQHAEIHTCQAAHIFRAAVHPHSPFHSQLFNHRIFPKIAEKSIIGTFPGK